MLSNNLGKQNNLMQAEAGPSCKQRPAPRTSKGRPLIDRWSCLPRDTGAEARESEPLAPLQGPARARDAGPARCARSSLSLRSAVRCRLSKGEVCSRLSES